MCRPTQLAALRRVSTATRGGLAATLTALVSFSLGDLWNRVFFMEQRIGLSLAVMFTLYGSLVTTAVLLYREDVLAGYLWLPVVAWVTIASTLNLSIYNLNTKAPMRARASPKTAVRGHPSAAAQQSQGVGARRRHRAFNRGNDQRLHQPMVELAEVASAGSDF